MVLASTSRISVDRLVCTVPYVCTLRGTDNDRAKGKAFGLARDGLCHYSEERDQHIYIEVAAPAVPAHLMHGDYLAEDEAESVTEEEEQL